MRNYIEFKIDDEGYLIAKMSHNGKYRIVRNGENITKLAEIAESYGYTINDEMRIVRHSRDIMNEYDVYKKNKRKINIYNRIKENMTLKRNNNSIGRRIAALSAAIIVVASGIAVANSTSKGNNIVEAKYIEMTDDNDDINDYLENIEYDDNELNTMVSKDNFHFSYEDRTSSENIDNVNQYDAIFQKYARMYGLDVNLLKAIACQESGGNHYDNLGIGPADGIMQIEKSVHVGQTISAYNFETKEIEEVYISPESLQDIDFNIKVGAMDLRNAIEAFTYNIPQGLQAYNYGIGGMNEALALCSSTTGIPQETLEKTPSNNEWLNYRDSFGMGDSKYIEHVFSYLPNNTVINILDKDGNNHSISIVNDYEMQNKRSLV